MERGRARGDIGLPDAGDANSRAPALAALSGGLLTPFVTPDAGAKPCSSCGSRKLWCIKGGRDLRCGRCHPPSIPQGEIEWFDLEQEEGAA